MAHTAMGFIEKPRTKVREMRSSSTGKSQEKHILISTQIRFICIDNLTLVLAGSQQTCNGVFRFSVFLGIGLCGRRADRRLAVGLAAATSGIDLSVQVGRALISYSNQALRTWHW